MATDDVNVPRLVVTGPAEQVGLVLRLSAPELVIGHSDTADLRLDDRFVSRRHALVTVDPSGSVTIRDLNSTGGTFVNDERLTGPRVLRAGDLVRFADLVARFEPASLPRAAAVPPGAPTQILAVPQGMAGPPSPADAGVGPADTAVGIAAAGPGGSAAGAGAAGPGGGGLDVQLADAGAVYTVTGVVRSPALPGVGGLTVQLVDKNVGGDQVLAVTQTSSDGSYAFSQPISAAYLAQYYKTQPDLQVQVYARSPSTAGAFLAASAVSYSAPPVVSADVVLPAVATGLPSEYEALTGNLAAAYPGSLGALQENTAQQDITYLANKTGWDARAVALAVLADQFSQLRAPAPEPVFDSGQTLTWPPPTVGMRPEFYYALFRAGLPASADTLFWTSPATAQAIWQKAVTGGVIPQALAKEVPAAATAFQALSAARSLDAPPPAGLSTMRQMLVGVLADPAQQDQFAHLYAQHRGDWTGFWAAAEQAFGTAATSRLRLTGQLHYLTINNQPLVTALLDAHADSPLGSVADLATLGYYESASWAPLIGGAIPPGIPGADAAEQAANYAQLLAAQVRVAFPTAVLADQVRRAILPVADTAGTAAGVVSFLVENADQFQVGVEPVEAYLARTGLTGTPAPVITQVKRLQRAYQLTPDDASMAVLLRHNLDSAFAITRYDPAGFARALGGELGGADTAAAIHARASQIFTSVLSVAIGYLSGRMAPDLGGKAPVHYGYPPQSVPPGYPVPAHATLERLFGSLDYCGCPDCGSILSPAAYLADLLHFLDQPAPAAGLNPQDVLFQRRPDLQYLPLTCANTNTALPCIDIANETLEYFVANGLSLAGYRGHDTGDEISSAELIASPQYVNDAAYGVLEGAFFPPRLPFTRPLTLLRLHLASLGVALPDAMVALRTGDQLVNHATPASYGWTDILIERLGISRAEYRVFTDPALQLGDLYGLPDASALATLQTTNVRDLTRRLQISYDDLAAIVATQFINPSAWLIPRLERLGASFATLQALHDNLGTPASIEAGFISALPAGLDATEYGGATPTDYQAVVSWVTSPKIYPLAMDIITIRDQGPGDDNCSGTAFQLRYSSPDNTKNLLSGTDLIKLIRFIRLWRKLTPLLPDAGNAVTIGQTDAMLAALYPAADLPVGSSDPANDAANRPLLDAGFDALLPRLGFLFGVSSQLSLAGNAALAPLLACWAPIGTVGRDALYRKLFLTPALLTQDPGAQTATVNGAVNTGDVLHTSINGAEEVAPYTVRAADTAASVAAAIVTAINAATAPDPVSGLPLNSRFFATSKDGTVTIRAGFTLECSASAGASERYTPAAGSPVSRSATVAGPVTAGDTLTTTIDGVAIPYTVAVGDTPATVAAGISATINGTTAADPYSGLPLNSLLAATSGGAVVTVTTVNAGAPFTLACSLDPATSGTYAAAPPVPAAQTATITGAVQAGDTLITTINSVQVPYTAGPTDTDATALAASIAATINAAVQPDPATNLPLSSVVHATSAGNVVTINAVDPATAFTLGCQVNSGAETYTAAGPFNESTTATVSGSIPPGAALTTTINSLPLVYQAAPGDTPASIAARIAAAINASTTAEPVTSLPLNSVVTASASGGVITVTAASPTTTFTLTASLSTGGYTAGRAAPPFADDGYGDLLADPSQTIFGHEPALCAACNLTGAEFTLIATALEFGPSTPLTLANVSALFRYGWLAHALGLSVPEFLLLRQFTGLDPFAPLDPAGTPPAEPPVIRFIRLLGALAAAGLRTAAALYLIWNQDLSGTSAPTPDSVNALALALRANFAAVDAQFTLRDDPDGSIAQGLMTLVYGATASDFFFGLLNNTFTTSVPYSRPPGQTALPQPVIAASAGRLSYDDLRKELSFGGVLDPATVAAIDGITGDPALTAAVASLAAANKQAVGPFFATYPELAPLYASYAASADPVQVKRTELLSSFLPVLQRKRKQEQALAAITAAAGTTPGFAKALLTDPAILHADADATTAAVADLVAVENQGLSAQFFLGNDPSAAPDQVADAAPSLTYAQTTTIGGTATAGDVLQTVVNGVTIPYRAGPADTTTALLAGNVAAAINATTTPDPASALPLNQVVSAAASGNVITISGRDPSGAGGFFSLDATVSAGATETYTAGSQLPAGQGAGPIAAVWSGYLAVPQDGDYDINIATDPGASIELRIGTTTVPGAQAGSLWSNQGPISLAAGKLVPITLTATSIRTTLSVSWRSLGVGWQPMSGQNLYSLSLVSRLGDTYVRFLKATSLASTLSLTPAETSYLATVASISPGWLNLLATQHDPDPATATSLCAVLIDVLDFSRIKQALSPADERLLAVLENPAATLPARPPAQTALLSLTGWAQPSVNALLTQFFGSTDPAHLSSVPNFRRVYDAYTMVKTCRLSAAVMISAITNAPSPATVSALQAALRARYAPPDWLAVIGPINDTARIAQRDALVAYILQRMGDGYAQSVVGQATGADAATGDTTLTLLATAGITTGMLVQGTAVAPGTTVTALAGSTVTISTGLLAALPSGSRLWFTPDAIAFDTPDSLYEYFLIDPQTQPPVRTSRIRLALSAVQLFIERALRNLEPQVAPADIDAARWAWMKRYRVWQANREVFLWPENWAYPQLRDNQSPEFGQMMSKLFQGDITDDAAASAYLDYLTSLEQIAKLEPCGLYYVPGSADADEVSYVVARTAGAHRKYFFRMLDSGSWTPWAEVKIDCEDLPLTPVVWNGRLFLFWLKVVKQAAQPKQADLSHVKNDAIANFRPSDLQTYSGATATAAGQGSVTVQAVLCWTEFSNGKWQPTKTSDVNQPTTIGSFDPAGPKSFEACRGQVKLVPATFTGASELSSLPIVTTPFTLPSDALILAITVASDWTGQGGFVLHNTHSLPVRTDDIILQNSYLDGTTGTETLADALDLPAPYRWLPTTQPYTGGYSAGTFTIDYTDTLGHPATYSNDLLQYNWMPRWTTPQPGLTDAWDAPFIYEDRRNQFYVTTTETVAPVWAFDGFGAQQPSQDLLASPRAIGPLVLRHQVTAAAPPEITAIAAAAGDPAAIRRYLSNAPTINAVLGSQPTFSFQGRLITPIGSTPSPGTAAGADGGGA